MALKKAAGKTTEAFHMAPPTQAPAQQVPAEFKPQQPQNLGFQPQAMDQFNPQQPMFNQGKYLRKAYTMSVILNEFLLYLRKKTYIIIHINKYRVPGYATKSNGCSTKFK